MRFKILWPRLDQHIMFWGREPQGGGLCDVGEPIVGVDTGLLEGSEETGVRERACVSAM